MKPLKIGTFLIVISLSPLSCAQLLGSQLNQSLAGERVFNAVKKCGLDKMVDSRRFEQLYFSPSRVEVKSAEEAIIQGNCTKLKLIFNPTSEQRGR